MLSGGLSGARTMNTLTNPFFQPKNKAKKKMTSSIYDSTPYFTRYEL